MILSILFLAAVTFTGPAVPPASETAVEEFLVSLPPAQPPADPGEPFDQDRLDRLIRLNPDRAAEVRSLHAANERCEETSKKGAVEDALRSAARALGDNKLAQLTAFYKGPEHELFSRLSQIPREELSDAESAELKRMEAAYPFEEFFQNMAQEEQRMWSVEGLFGDLMKCAAVLDSELAERGLKS